MCGISGHWASRRSFPNIEVVAERMAATLCHRGPDSGGVWVDGEAGIALGHRRLAILDLSPAGQQPMNSASGRYCIVFNGEIFNFEDVRRQLPSPPPFRGDSDTEVMLAAIEEYGVESAVRTFVGMFAFALWDRHEQALYLVRDRLGIKPIYFGHVGTSLVFGSELKAFRVHPEFSGQVDRDSIAELLRYNCIPAPHSIYQGVSKLMPGTIARFDRADSFPAYTTYWSAQEVAEKGAKHPFAGSEAVAIDRLEALLDDAVRIRMVSDVPLGAFLSGGVDSSLVVALMQRRSARPVKTFSIGSHDRRYDESRHAAAVARHLGTEHTELLVSAEDALAVVPRLATIYDEPFADSSQIPTYLVSALARQQVVVSLSGDGGDELFAGYNRHVWAPRVWSAMRRMPRPLRSRAGGLISSLPADRLDRLYGMVDRYLPMRLRQQMFGYKVNKLGFVAGATGMDDLYGRLASHWSDPASVIMGLTAGARMAHPSVNGLGDAERMMYRDLVTYLPDDILTKVDRASMAVGLEARVPLLDHRVVEFAWTIPMSMKIRDGQGKWILRQVLYRHVPRSLIERPKAGFGVPLSSWLRGPLRDWAEGLLQEDRLRREGFFKPEPIRAMWSMHLEGRGSWHYHLWDILMFQLWLESESREAASASLTSAGHA